MRTAFLFIPAWGYVQNFTSDAQFRLFVKDALRSSLIISFSSLFWATIESQQYLTYFLFSLVTSVWRYWFVVCASLNQSVGLLICRCLYIPFPFLSLYALCWVCVCLFLCLSLPPNILSLSLSLSLSLWVRIKSTIKGLSSGTADVGLSLTCKMTSVPWTASHSFHVSSMI